tara:strand:- start:1613 stop:1834 length:222 start_codon:yes stop_codon:yes gene_type:complete
MITTKKISKKYGDFTAIDNLSFDVKQGEIMCLLGANGAGKSTAINILLNFTQPTNLFELTLHYDYDCEKHPSK